MKMRFRFERLDVWQTARSLNRSIYQLSRKFPIQEQYVLVPQVRRASISIASNIAEGSGRNSDKDFAHFLEQAYGSLVEVASQLYLALDEGYVTAADLDEVFEKVEKVAGQLVALNRSLGGRGEKVKAANRNAA